MDAGKLVEATMQLFSRAALFTGLRRNIRNKRGRGSGRVPARCPAPVCSEAFQTRLNRYATSRNWRDMLKSELARNYDQLAEAFAARVDTRAYNAHYERPATLSLLPPVAGQHVLDAGCGPGAYCDWLAAHGASVVGIDSSPKMVALARRRLGARADIRQGDLGQPLSDLASGAFDGVLSALVLDYVRDWAQVLGEFHRVLRPGGWLVFSVDHPFDQFYDHPNGGDYFATETLERRWYWSEMKGPVIVTQ